MKVALIYDRVNKWGGAERVLLALHQMFPEAPLYTSVYNPIAAPWAKVFDIKVSFLQYFPFAQIKHELYAPLMPMAFESFSFDEYDLVISVTSESAKGIITKPHTKHICLCLTPTRYLWSGYNEYFKNEWMRFFSTPIVAYLRFWDIIASHRPDTFIAISKEVQKRITKYYHRDAEVIYPPLMIENKKVSQGKKTKDYFLVVSRLSQFTSYKRVDIAIAAANQLGITLKIVGEGDIDYFKNKAGATIEFVGKISDGQLEELYRGAKALIFPGLEDFGLVMVEAQSYGTPVVAFKAGGALEIVKEGKTGEFFSHQTVASLRDVLEKFDEKRYNGVDCIENAEKFSFSHFKASVQAYLKRI